MINHSLLQKIILIENDWNYAKVDVQKTYQTNFMHYDQQMFLPFYRTPRWKAFHYLCEMQDFRFFRNITLVHEICVMKQISCTMIYTSSYCSTKRRVEKCFLIYAKCSILGSLFKNKITELFFEFLYTNDK